MKQIKETAEDLIGIIAVKWTLYYIMSYQGLTTLIDFHGP